ncbi:hypothetical protein [Aquirhabdus sp.]|uniref:hypothetical protein n=1 Tax=Aquirhabdus sp. TaxID=2824160 RepID=UPI00396CCF92
MKGFYIAVEDQLSNAVAVKILSHYHPTVPIVASIVTNGNQELKKKIESLISVARILPVLVLTDLDQISCAPRLIESWIHFKNIPAQFFFRVVVKEIESWLLADKEGFSGFIGSPLTMIPNNVETLDSKRALLQLTQRYGTRSLKADILPARGSPSKVGIGYNQCLIKFVNDTWSVESAIQNSQSLARACRRIEEYSAL